MRKIGNKLRTKRQRLRKTQRKYKKQNRRTGRKQNRRTKRAMRGGVNADGSKVVVLIIDPQNDFSDNMVPAAPLQVAGAEQDYANICDFINRNPKIDEIHVSLDTHTPNHIGHKGFWVDFAYERDKPESPENPKNPPPPFTTLTLDKDNKITGSNEKHYKPANDRFDAYAIDYIRDFTPNSVGKYPPNNRHQKDAYVWPTHCLEGDPGHKIHKKIGECLKNTKIPVKYHIKGQNNLAEMYSIFSASRPFVASNYDFRNDELYGGGKNSDFSNPNLANGKPTYEEAIKEINLETGLNDKLMAALLGPIDNPNTVYVCGEAKTHCVKSSLIDLINYQKSRTGNAKNIVLIKDCSSPIIPLGEENGGRKPHDNKAENDIINLGGTVKTVNEIIL